MPGQPSQLHKRKKRYGPPPQTIEKKAKKRPVTARYVEEKLKHRLEQLIREADKSKTAEAIKLQKNGKEPEKLTALNNVSQSRLAAASLYKRLVKIQVIQDDPRFTEAIPNVLPASSLKRPDDRPKPSKLELDVEAKIANNKHFREDLNAAIDYLLSLAAQPVPVEPKATEEVGDDGWDGFGEAENAEMDWSGMEDNTAADSTPDEDGSDHEGYFDDEDDGDVVDDDGWESGSVDETGQVIPSTNRPYDESSESDSGDSDDAPIDLTLGASLDSDSDSGSGSFGGSMSGDDKDEGELSAPGPSKPKPKANLKAGESVFLPSLSVGFIPGGHDPYDDYENADIDGGGSGAALRKNRRGQRARRMIWEKKYGSRAKHMQNVRELQAQEAKRKADLKAERLAKRAGKTRPAPLPQSETAIDQDAITRRKSEKEKKEGSSSKAIHPAWEAKIKMKRKEAAVMASKPQGKKIVFS